MNLAARRVVFRQSSKMRPWLNIAFSYVDPAAAEQRLRHLDLAEPVDGHCEWIVIQHREIC